MCYDELEGKILCRYIPILLYKMYCTFIIKLHAILIQIAKNNQSAQKRYETLVVTWVSFTTSNDCNNSN